MEWHRRSQPRVPVHYPVRLHSDDNMGAGILMNLSPSGCQVRSTLPLETGTYVAVDITVPHQAQPVAVELSIVRWEHNGKYGLEFVKYAQDGRDRLLQLTTQLPAVYAGKAPAHLTASPASSVELQPQLATVGE